MTFNQEAILIPYLQDVMAYTIFLHRLLPGLFKIFLTKSKGTILAEALRRARDFIPATEIYAEG